MDVRRTSDDGFGAAEILLGILIAVALIGAGLLVYRHDRKAPAASANVSYQSVVATFVAAMKNGNATTVGSLETPRFRNWIRTSTTAEKNTKGEHGAVVTDNFYSLARQDEQLNLFSRQTLADAHITAGPYQSGLYMAPEGTTGHSETYSTRTGSAGAANYSPAFTIDVVRAGNAWLVDNVGFYATAT